MVVSHAQKEIIGLLLTQNAVPLPKDRDDMTATAACVAMQSVVGKSIAAQPKAVTKQMMEAMSAVHQSFKKYCSHNLHNQFKLHRPVGDSWSDIDYHASRVLELLSGVDFLRDSIDHLFFSSQFFHNFIIDVLFLTSWNLWSFILDDDLNHVFGLGGAAIAAALRDFRDGYYLKLDSSAVQWREDYTRTMRIITGMREQPAHKEWLVTCQQNLLVRGRAGLQPTSTVD